MTSDMATSTIDEREKKRARGIASVAAVESGRSWRDGGKNDEQGQHSIDRSRN
jgi:hypothetical protein